MKLKLFVCQWNSYFLQLTTCEEKYEMWRNINEQYLDMFWLEVYDKQVHSDFLENLLIRVTTDEKT